jgi:hypothetical protein
MSARPSFPQTLEERGANARRLTIAVFLLVAYRLLVESAAIVVRWNAGPTLPATTATGSAPWQRPWTPWRNMPGWAVGR